MIFRFFKLFKPKSIPAATGGLGAIILAAGGSAALLVAAPFISGWEGRVHTPYQDSGGVWTVCDGHTKNVVVGKTYSDEECDYLYAADLVEAEKAVKRIIKTPLPEQVHVAFVSFTFNVGEGNLSKSTLARLANKGDLTGACNQLKRWVYVDKRILRGLENRRWRGDKDRMSERELCLKGLET